MTTKHKPIPFLFHFEREQGLNREGKERPTESPVDAEAAAQIERRKAALYWLKHQEWTRALYGADEVAHISADHFQIFFESGYTNDEKATFLAQQVNDYMVVCGFLQTLPQDKPIKMYVYLTREAKSQNDPLHTVSRASYRSLTHSIYRVWDRSKDSASFPHEIVHAVTQFWGKPYPFSFINDTADGKEIRLTVPCVSLSFLEEGIAIAADELAFYRKLREGEEMLWPDEYVQRMLVNGVPIPPLASMLKFDDFCAHDNVVAVPMAASWTKYLLTQMTMDKYKELYVSMRENMSIPELESVFLQKTGVSLEDSQKAWLHAITPTPGKSE
jgi:hypothetical protein